MLLGVQNWLDVGSMGLQEALGWNRVRNDLVEFQVEGLSKHGMCDESLLEKRRRSDAFRSVDDLRWNNEVTRANLLLQRANGGKGDDGFDADLLQRSDVGSGRNIRGKQIVVRSMARQKGNSLSAGGLGHGNWGGWEAPWSGDGESCDGLEVGQVVETCASNNSQMDFFVECMWQGAQFGVRHVEGQVEISEICQIDRTKVWHPTLPECQHHRHNDYSQ